VGHTSTDRGPTERRAGLSAIAELLVFASYRCDHAIAVVPDAVSQSIRSGAAFMKTNAFNFIATAHTAMSSVCSPVHPASVASKS